jgi:hypothetical protein
MKRILWIVLCAAALVLSSGPKLNAAGNLASRPTDLDALVMDANLNFSVKEYKIETGKYYRWKIESKGGEEFQLFMPELFRNAWVNEIVINKIEIKTPYVYSLEFDEPGVVEMTFVPLRPGRYPYFVKGFENKGMQGVFVVN